MMTIGRAVPLVESEGFVVSDATIGNSGLRIMARCATCGQRVMFRARLLEELTDLVVARPYVEHKATHAGA